MELSKQTTAFLPYDSLAPMWHAIQSSACYDSAAPTERLWPDFLHAIAKRDRPEITRLGTGLLQRRMVVAGSDDAGMVLAAVAASMYGAGQAAAARRFLRAWAPLLGGRDPHVLALRILAAASSAG